MSINTQIKKKLKKKEGSKQAFSPTRNHQFKPFLEKLVTTIFKESRD